MKELKLEKPVLRKQGTTALYLQGKPLLSLESVKISRGGNAGRGSPANSNIETLEETDAVQECLNSARRFMSYRPRSESEIKQKLSRSFKPEIVGIVLDKLRECHLIDDTSFARFWKENRVDLRPRSRRLIGQELAKKRVSPEIIKEVTADINEQESAYRAALPRAQKINVKDYRVFYGRIGGFLKRRGFNHEVINQTVKNLWQELQGKFPEINEEEIGND